MSSPVLWYATRATGVTALLLLTATVVLGLLTAIRYSAPGWPGVAQQDIHRRVSLLSVLFVAGHVLTSVLDSYVHIGWVAVVVPFASGYKRLWVGVGAIALDLLLAVLVTSLLRRRISARAWRGVHWLSYLSWPAAVAHALAIGTDAHLAWVLGLVVTCILAVAGAVAVRVVRSPRRRRAARAASRRTPTTGAPGRTLTAAGLEHRAR